MQFSRVTDFQGKGRLGFDSSAPWCRGWLALLLGLGWVCMAWGQDLLGPRAWLVRTWETEHGLPENSANAVVQTSDGYLWFATFAGVVRFDGATFTIFNPATTPELPSDGVVNLHLDQRGRLWISTLKGLVWLENGTWQRVVLPPEVLGEMAAVVRTFSERANGELLLTMFGGPILEYTAAGFRVLPPVSEDARRGSLGVVDRDGRWWVTQDTRLFRWEGQGWERVEIPESSAGKATEEMSCGPAHGGGFWLVRGRELTRWQEGQLRETRTLPEHPGGFWSLSEDRNRHVWICTYEQGVCEVAPDGRMYRWTTPELSYRGVRTAFQDREDNVWIGTSGGGLARLKPRRFVSWGEAEGLTQRVVKSVDTDSVGRVWIGTYGKGVFRIEPDGKLESVEWPYRARSMYVQSVFADHRDRVWIGTFQQGLWVWEKGEYREEEDPILKGGNFIAMFEDSRRRLWISDGIGVVLRENDRYRRLRTEEGLPSAGVWGFTEDRDGAIWLTNLNGVYRWTGERFEEQFFGQEKSFGQISCLLADADGSLWLGSLNEGLMRWRGGTLERFDAKVGFPSEGVNAILEDGQGGFWLPSNRGITRVERSSLEAVAEGRSPRLVAQLLTQSDGLPSIECARNRQPICAQDPAGRLWFATLKGVAQADPARFRPNTLSPPTHIERLIYELTPASDTPIRPAADPNQVVLRPPFPPVIQLPRGSRRVEIHYAAPSLVAPEKVQFEVNLDGSEFWGNLGARRVAYFESLGPGQHVFRVRASNNDGWWNLEETELTFEVLPQFWQTGWFQGLVVSAVVFEAGLLAGLVLLQRHRRRVETELQQRRVELAHVSRLVTVGELTASLAHELNHPQSAILSNAQAGELFLKANPPALEEVRRILSDIVRDNRRANEIILRLRAFLKKRELEFEAIELNPLVREIIPLVESELTSRKVALTLDLGANLPLVRGDRIHLQQVLLNLLLNALDALATVEGRSRTLVVRTDALDSRTVEVAVEDSGVGIPAGKLKRVFDPFFTTKSQGMGMGLSITRTIVEAHGGQVGVENNPHHGVTIRFTLLALRETKS
ncbi:MAG: hypothetical protein J0M24_06820 [Verrucomicrobia bacterium]|nr:hypothetical protein [Verrucomicrobiota bacterium]